MGDADIQHHLIEAPDVQEWMDRNLDQVDEDLDSLFDMCSQLNNRIKQLESELNGYKLFKNLVWAMNLYVIPVIAVMGLSYGTQEIISKSRIEVFTRSIMLVLMYISSSLGLPLYIITLWEAVFLSDDIHGCFTVGISPAVGELEEDVAADIDDDAPNTEEEDGYFANDTPSDDVGSDPAEYRGNDGDMSAEYRRSDGNMSSEEMRWRYAKMAALRHLQAIEYEIGLHEEKSTEISMGTTMSPDDSSEIPSSITLDRNDDESSLSTILEIDEPEIETDRNSSDNNKKITKIDEQKDGSVSDQAEVNEETSIAAESSSEIIYEAMDVNSYIFPLASE